jgi:hypothetical protein
MAPAAAIVRITTPARPVPDETGLDGHYDFVIAFGETKPSDGSAESFGALS